MKILMATMSMGLGGAETHVLELSLELARRGHRVFVASNGGEYVPLLEAGGVEHISVPLHSKDPRCVAAAKKRLSELMEKERFDIVHAHARIPAFICGGLKKKYGYIFVTTAHFDFKVNALLARITDWGERVLAVSEDIADSVVQKYGYQRENITVVNNGIDTARFSPENDGEKIRKALDLGGKKIIMYLGRLDDDSSRGAKALLESAPLLYDKNKDVRVVIVGNGENLDEMRKRADEINVVAGENIAFLPGGTTDAASYIAACDVFVAPSRSAMEALASGKPTVVAGNFGMLGIFSPEIEHEAKRTNFCCRGSEPATAEKIAADVLKLLSCSEEEREALSNYGRRFIEENYSVRAMCDTCEKVYFELRQTKKKSVVICGYYGYGNMGDEAMLASLVSSLKDSECVGNICVMSARPKQTAEKYGVCAVSRFSVHDVCRELSKADAMIFGGGNILQDKTSTKSLMYYLQIIRMARVHSCKVMLCANGIGPVVRQKNMARVREALELSDYISIRDEASLALARTLTGRDDICGTSDIVFALKLEDERNIDCDEKYFVVCPKRIKGFSADTLARVCSEIKRKYSLAPVFVCMHEKEDMALCGEIAAKLGGARILSGEEGLQAFAYAEFSICMRLHAAIFSLASKCPMLGISDDGKMSSFMASLGVDECPFFPADVQSEDIMVAVRGIVEDRADIRDSLRFEAAKHKDRAEKELLHLSDALSEM